VGLEHRLSMACAGFPIRMATTDIPVLPETFAPFGGTISVMARAGWRLAAKIPIQPKSDLRLTGHSAHERSRFWPRSPGSVAKTTRCLRPYRNLVP